MNDPAPPTEKLPFDLQGDEAVLLMRRRHWMYLLPKLALLVLIAIVPPIGLYFILDRAPGFSETSDLLLLGLSVVWLLFWGVRSYFLWYRYQNDIWVVTNQRIVDSKRNHWFHHSMASADLVDVEDINVVREGLLPTAFNFGDVKCQTAGAVSNFVLAGVPDPTRTLGVVDSARDAARRQLARPSG